MVEAFSTLDAPSHRAYIYEAISNQLENCHVHDRPGRSWVVDFRQLISFTFSVQTGQLASLVIMTILTLVGYCLVRSVTKRCVHGKVWWREARCIQVETDLGHS